MTPSGLSAPPSAGPSRPDGRPLSLSSSRASRRRLRQEQRVRRRRRLAVLAAGLVAMVGVNLAGVGPDVVGGSIDRIVPGASPAEPVAVGSLLLAVPAGDSAAFVLFGAAEGGGAALLVPGETQVEVPSLGSLTLVAALDARGGATAALALENALGVDVGSTAVVEGSELRELLAVGAPLDVRLRAPVEVGGREWAAGDHAVDAREAAALVEAGVEDAFDGLVTLHAVLEGWIDGLDGDGAAEAAALLGKGSSVERLLGVLAADRVTFDALSVDSVPVPGGERYTASLRAEEEARALFPALALAAPGVARPRVEVRNATGEPGLAEHVARRIVPAGFRVVLSGNASDFGQAETVVVIHDQRMREQAEELIRVLGAGVLRAAARPVSVVDISIVVGHDFGPGDE